MVDHSSAYNSVYKSMYFGRFDPAIGYEMKMIGHYDVSEDHEFARLSGFVDRPAGKQSNFIGSENRQPVFRNGRQVVCGRVSGYCEPVWRHSLLIFYENQSARQATPHCIRGKPPRRYMILST